MKIIGLRGMQGYFDRRKECEQREISGRSIGLRFFKQAGNSLLLSALLVGFSACGTTGASSRAAAAGGEAAEKEEETPMIAVGMTKAQVLRAWGEPNSKQVSGRGEIWVWGGQNWKRMIPYAGPFMNVQTSKALFGTDGRVKDFRLTDKGSVMSEAEGYSGGFNSW